MSINIHDVLSILISDYVPDVPKTKSKETGITDVTNIEKISFDNNSFNTVLKCIVHNLSLDFDEQKEKILTIIDNSSFNELLNIKKINMSIEQDSVNNEVFLFLSGYFNINIYVYHTVSRIMRIYYLEETLCTNKDSVLLLFTQNCNEAPENNKDFYQTTLEPTIFTHDDDYIQEKISAVHIIPIGLLQKKKLHYSQNHETVPFIVTPDVPNNNFINEDNILYVDDTPMLVAHEVYDYRTFDVRAFNERYNKKKMLMEFYSLKRK